MAALAPAAEMSSAKAVLEGHAAPVRFVRAQARRLRPVVRAAWEVAEARSMTAKAAPAGIPAPYAVVRRQEVSTEGKAVLAARAQL